MINRSSVALLAAVLSVLFLLSAVLFTGCSSGEEAPAPTTTAASAEDITTTTSAVTQQGKLDASDVIVRSGPGMDYEAIGGLAHGEEFVIVGREGDWYRIKFGDGYGYVSAQYVDVEGQPNKSEMVAGRTTATASATTTGAQNQEKTTKPQDQAATTKPAAVNGSTAAASETGATAQGGTTTSKSNGGLAMEHIPDTGIIDEF